MAFEHNDIVTKYAMDAAIAEGGGGFAPDYIVHHIGSTSDCTVVAGDFDAVVEKLMSGDSVVIGYLLDVQHSSGLYHIFNIPHTVEFDANYPTQIDLVIDSAHGVHWTAEGARYYTN